MNSEGGTFISATVFTADGFDDYYKRSYPKQWAEIQAGLSDGSVIVKTGTGYRVKWMKGHDCDCKYCDHEEYADRFFEKKEDADGFIEEIESDPDEAWDIRLIDGVSFTKAIKQRLANEGLFA